MTEDDYARDLPSGAAAVYIIIAVIAVITAIVLGFCS